MQPRKGRDENQRFDRDAPEAPSAALLSTAGLPRESVEQQPPPREDAADEVCGQVIRIQKGSGRSLSGLPYPLTGSDRRLDQGGGDDEPCDQPALLPAPREHSTQRERGQRRPRVHEGEKRRVSIGGPDSGDPQDHEGEKEPCPRRRKLEHSGSLRGPLMRSRP